VASQQVEADDAAHRGSPEGRPRDAELIEYSNDIIDLTVYSVTVDVARCAAPAVTTGVDEDKAIAVGESVHMAG
jgi:hypothetical protein